MRRLSLAARRYPLRVLLLWALGAVVIGACALALSDPALVMFALDPELVAVLVLSSIALLRGSPALALVISAGRAVRRRLMSPRGT